MEASMRSFVVNGAVATKGAVVAFAALAVMLLTNGTVLADTQAVYAAGTAKPAFESVAAIVPPVARSVTARPIHFDAHADYGVDPDPTRFDRAGLEYWWAKYNAHRTP
jgi:hypothetical protein